MTLTNFIKNNKVDLDRVIHERCMDDRPPLLNNEERRLWILNDESLYLWALSEGVPL